MPQSITFQVITCFLYFEEVIDRASLTEKSARKDEKTLCWPPPLIAHLVTKSTGNKTAQK